MELFANELSVERQFQDAASFRSALTRLLSVRKVAREFDREVRCHRGFAQIEPIRGIPFRQAVQGMDRDRVRTVMQWLDRSGPFWDDERRHGEDDGLWSGEEPVTGTAVGEVAYRKWEGEECALVSARPGDWDFSPVPATFGDANGAGEMWRVEIENWREEAALRQRLETLRPPVVSWQAVRAEAIRRFCALRFSEDCFDRLDGIPFNRSAADSVLRLLRLLERLAGEFQDGSRTAEGNRIYQQFFTGKTALFSDSSKTEKSQFRKELTFPHPDMPGRTLFCPWHGKVRQRRSLLRLHFSWPIRAGEPVYVVYVGRKRTTR